MPLTPIRTLLTLCVAITPYASGQDAKPGRDGNPLAPFEILIADEWKVTAQSGQSMFHRWHWGPGKHSIHRMTDGAGAGGEPWREAQVYYWHPGRKRICTLGFSPYARGINEGTVTFDGKTADGVSDLFQTGVKRNMGLRWAFDGTDTYRETLLESTGPEGLKPLVEFDHLRVKPPDVPRPVRVDGAKPILQLEAFKPFPGQTWAAKGTWSDTQPVEIRTTFEWVPLADVMTVKTMAQTGSGEWQHVLDAFVYHHTGANAVRCLALSHSGSVSKGDVKIIEGGAFEMSLTRFEPDRTARYVVRFESAKDGSILQRIWSVHGTERTILLELTHRKIEVPAK
jgi:hypothetical protein